MTQTQPPALSAPVKAAIRKEFTTFFVTMTTAHRGTWPAIPNSEFVDALADSLVEMGEQRGLGVALLQTLVHELQDRINSKTN